MKKKTLNGSQILWVEYWIRQAHPSYSDYTIEATQLENGKWCCEIEIPILNGFVRCKSNTEVEAVMAAAEKAANKIESFIKQIRLFDIKNEFKDKPYLIETDNQGRILSIGLSSEYREKEGEELGIESFDYLNIN